MYSTNETLWDPKLGKASDNEKCCKSLKMTNFLSKHVALLKNKIDCAHVYCVKLISSIGNEMRYSRPGIRRKMFMNMPIKS